MESDETNEPKEIKDAEEILEKYTLHGHKLRFFTHVECAICDRGHYRCLETF